MLTETDKILHGHQEESQGAHFWQLSGRQELPSAERQADGKWTATLDVRQIFHHELPIMMR